MSEQEFRSCREAWNGLQAASARPSFFLKWEWVFAFWETLNDATARLLTLAMEEGGRLVGVAPLYVRRTQSCFGKAQTIGFLGDQTAGDYLDVLALPGYEARATDAAMAHVLTLGGIDVIDLIGAEASSAIVAWWHAHARFNRIARISTPAPRLALPVDRDAPALGPSVRQDLRRKERRLRREFADVAVRVLPFDGSGAPLATLFRLHGSRWQTLGLSAFNTADQKRFHARLQEKLGPGDGFFLCIDVDGTTRAIVYLMTDHDTCYYYQMGWDTAFERYSIGLIALGKAIDACRRSGLAWFDALRGDEDYKSRITNGRRDIMRLIWYKASATGVVQCALFRAKQFLKDLRARVKSWRIKAA